MQQSADLTVYYDPNTATECFVLGNGRVFASLPSAIEFTPDQAELFGKALIRCAEQARKEPKRD